MTKFSYAYEIVGTTIVWISLVFIVLALLAAVIEVYKAAQKPRSITKQDTQAAVVPPITAIIEALKGLVTALTGGPLWLGLLICGVLLFYVPASAVSALCAQTCNTKETTPTKPTKGDG